MSKVKQILVASYLDLDDNTHGVIGAGVDRKAIEEAIADYFGNDIVRVVEEQEYYGEGMIEFKRVLEIRMGDNFPNYYVRVMAEWVDVWGG